MDRTKKPKVQIKRQKTSLGWAYRIYIDGMYMGTGLTRASARDGVKRMLANYESRWAKAAQEFLEQTLGVDVPVSD
jgi:outer membrane biogenesis lipoprotein LolB